MPKRRFFQLHLSTAVVLMLVAGVLVWANVQPWYARVDPRDNHYWLAGQGWPFPWNTEFRNVLLPDFASYYEIVRQSSFPSGLIYNALIDIAILLCVWVACEWRIRWREKLLLKTSP